MFLAMLSLVCNQKQHWAYGFWQCNRVTAKTRPPPRCTAVTFSYKPAPQSPHTSHVKPVPSATLHVPTRNVSSEQTALKHNRSSLSPAADQLPSPTARQVRLDVAVQGLVTFFAVAVVVVSVAVDVLNALVDPRVRY